MAEDPLTEVSRPERCAQVAYFTMEVALVDALPTYSGGLGVLAGDYLRSAADLGLPLVAVTLLYRQGYFRQEIDEHGRQSEQPVRWSPEAALQPLELAVGVEIEGRSVRARAWRYEIVGATGWRVRVYFLDSDVEGNEAGARSITDQLYGGDGRHRLSQEALLGIGGVELLRALGEEEISTFHMNEGHSALLALRLAEIEQDKRGDAALAAVMAEVRRRCVFTTHTPVAAGHDRFPADLVAAVLGEGRTTALRQLGFLEGGQLDMTDLGVGCSRFVNAVSRRHREVTRRMFPQVGVRSITNGVHSVRWASESVGRLFDDYLEGWRRDSSLLRYAATIPLEDVAGAHRESKSRLLDEVARRTDADLDPAALTIGLARRVTPYKQTTLLFSDLDRLRALVNVAGPLQVLCAGKAHPRDWLGKEMIEQLSEAARALAGEVSVVFVENYDLELAALLCAGSDVWLNNPAKPNEASGTSGMKAALNGVPSLSVLDGWWIEGWIEGVTGWAVGGADEGDDSAGALYDKLELAVLPTFYGDAARFAEIRRSAIALNGSFFATDRMVREYARAAYLL